MGPARPGDYVGRVLFTGYFTPIYPASLTRTGAYQWPLYKRPADLVVGRGDRDLRPARPDGRLAPHFSRAEIERDGKLAGQEFVWLANRFDAYVITVQGSAVLRLPDGRTLEVGYAGQNGHPYVSPGMQMVADGVIQQGRPVAEDDAGVLRRQPRRRWTSTCWMNPRTVFFTERPGGPFGKPEREGDAVRDDRDRQVRLPPRDARVPGRRPLPRRLQPAPFRGFMLDQDTGGAIRAAGRADIYMGIGPGRGRARRRQMNEGELYYLAVK